MGQETNIIYVIKVDLVDGLSGQLYPFWYIVYPQVSILVWRYALRKVPREPWRGSIGRNCWFTGSGLCWPSYWEVRSASVSVILFPCPLSRTCFVKYMKLTYSGRFNSIDCLIIILIAAICFDLVWSDLPTQKPACSSLRSLLTPALIFASTCGKRQGLRLRTPWL